MLSMITEKLVEVLGVVCLHAAAEHVVTDRRALAAALSHSTVFRSRLLRVSMSQILSLAVRDKYVLIFNIKRPERVAPIGGVIRYFACGANRLEGDIGFEPELKKAHEKYDLRGYIKGKEFATFLKWFASGSGREHLALAREIDEELIEIGIKKKGHLVRRPEFSKIRVIHEGPEQVDTRHYWQYRYFEVCRLQEDSDVTKELADFIRSQIGKNLGLFLVGTDEIRRGRTADGRIIADSAGYLLSDKRMGISPPPLM